MECLEILKSKGIAWLPSTKEKKPALSSYKEYFTTAPNEQNYKEWLEGIQDRRYDGIQIINGKISKGLFTIDFDSKDENLIRAVLYKDINTLKLETWVSSTPHGFHVHYFADNDIEVGSKQFSSLKVDIKGEKSLSKEWPSENYTNLSMPDVIKMLSKEEIERLLSKLKLLDRNWAFIEPVFSEWKQGRRQLLALAFAGFMRKRLNLDIKSATEIMLFICRLTNDEETATRVIAIQQTFSKSTDETAIHTWFEQINLQELDKKLYSLLKSNQNKDENSKIWIELPGLNRPVSEFVSEIADFYSTQAKLFYRINTDEIVRIGPVDLDKKGMQVLGLIPINADSLITFVEEDFAFFTFGEDGKMGKSIGPNLAKVILNSLDQFKVKLPIIKRLFPVPMPYLIDGKLSFPKRGYDSTHFSFMPFNIPEIDPNMPLDKAKELLNYTYAEFAFTSEQDRVNAIAHLLTPFCRGLFTSETSRPPLFIYMANRERSGKDYAAGVVSIVYEGEAIEDTAVSKENSNDEEFRKKIFAVLSSGRSIFHSANNKGFINSAELEGLITREYHRDRKLGANVEYTFPNVLTISMSANTGLSYTPDIQYRSVFINLFLAIEDPNERTFKNPTLHQWVKEHRSEILSALYALVKNWYEKEMPSCSKPFASFPEWMRVVGGILETAAIGIPTQNDTLNSIGGNREEIAMKQFFETAFQKWPNEWTNKSEILNTIENRDTEGSMNPEEGFEEIFDFLIWNKNPSSARMRFGRLLSKYANRILSSVLMEEDKTIKTTRNRYRFMLVSSENRDPSEKDNESLSTLSILSTSTTPSNQKVEVEERKEEVEKADKVDKADMIASEINKIDNFPEIGEPI